MTSEPEPQQAEGPPPLAVLVQKIHAASQRTCPNGKRVNIFAQWIEIREAQKLKQAQTQQDNPHDMCMHAWQHIALNLYVMEVRYISLLKSLNQQY